MDAANKDNWWDMDLHKETDGDMSWFELAKCQIRWDTAKACHIGPYENARGPSQVLSGLDDKKMSQRSVNFASKIESKMVTGGQSGSLREMATAGYPIHPSATKKVNSDDVRGVLLQHMGYHRKGGGKFSAKVSESLQK